MPLIAELRRRNVFRVAAAYVVVGWLLTEVLSAVLPTLGAPEWVQRAVVLIFALGFIPAVVLAWFYELTPDGIKRDTDVDDLQWPRTRAWRTLDYVTVGGVVVLIVFVGLFSARQTGEGTRSANTVIDSASVAVLPFENMSNDDDNEYFSEGLSETLLHMLAQVPDLKVAARTSSFAFKNQNKSVPEIAAALGVAHVLEGSVQRAGDRVRITAQLIRASDGFHVWSSSYDRTLDNIFDIQDEIAQKVGAALTESLLGPSSQDLAGVQTESPDAYDLYLQARRELATYSYGGLRGAEDLLKGALLIDPGFVEAKTELASSYIQQVETGLKTPAEAFPEIRAIVEQVLEVRPDDVVARAIHAYVDTLARAMQGDTAADMAGLVSQLDSLHAAEPAELQVLILLVRAYQATHQEEKSIPALTDALRRDPFNARISYELGTAYMRTDRPDEARDALQQSLAIEPAQPNAYAHLALISAESGDGVGYAKNILKALETDPRDKELPGMLAVFLYFLELVDEGDDFRARVLTIAPTSAIAYRTELLRAIAAGDSAAAEASARRAVQDNVEPRHFAFSGAIQYLLRTAIANGSVKDELAWIEARHPGIFDIDSDTVPAKYREAQTVVFDAWYVTLPRDELLRRLDRLIEVSRPLGFIPADDPYARLRILALRGDVQAAIRVALDEIFSRSVVTNLGWEQVFAQSQFQDIVADTRVQAAMQRWRDEEAQVRDNVAAYLADLQARG